MSPIAARGKTARAIVMLGGIFAVYMAGRVLGLEQYLHAERIRELVAEAGAFGPLAFLALFVGAVVAQVPGVVFVVAAPALFHFPQALALCWLASILAVIANFELVRRVDGLVATPDDSREASGRFRGHLAPSTPPGQLHNAGKRSWLAPLFAGLEAHPIRTVVLLRIITIMFPPVTGALALTQVSARDHAVGSALGMLPPITLILALTGWLIG
jgi:uncharacterized membrane protein YdjX (TVP38/TMEM64 family)